MDIDAGILRRSDRADHGHLQELYGPCSVQKPSGCRVSTSAMESPMIMAKRTNSSRAGHNFENDILVAARNIAKRYSSAARAISKDTGQIWHWLFLTA